MYNSIPTAKQLQMSDQQIPRDYWGNAITHDIVSSNRVRIISYGKDGVIGGNDDDRDMVGELVIPFSEGKYISYGIQWDRWPLLTK